MRVHKKDLFTIILGFTLAFHQKIPSAVAWPPKEVPQQAPVQPRHAEAAPDLHKEAVPSDAKEQTRFFELKAIYQNKEARNPSVSEIDALPKPAGFNCLERWIDIRSDMPINDEKWTYNEEELHALNFKRGVSGPYSDSRFPGGVTEHLSLEHAKADVTHAKNIAFSDHYLFGKDGQAQWASNRSHASGNQSQVRVILKWSPTKKKMMMKRVELMTKISDDGSTISTTAEKYCLGT